MSDESDVPILIPEGKSATDLTMGELDVASYHLKADVLACIGGDRPEKRYGAFVEVAMLWAKRGGATESRDVLQKRFRDYTPDQIFRALRMDKVAAGEPLDPTSSSDESSEPSSLESSDDSLQS